MTCYPVPAASRGERALPKLRLAATLIAIPIFLELAGGVLGGISFEPDAYGRWDAFVAAPLVTGGLAATGVWLVVLYWLRARAPRPGYAAIALVVVAGCLLAGRVDRDHRAHQEPQLTAALDSDPASLTAIGVSEPGRWTLEASITPT